MLKDLNDVQSYTERLASTLPDLAAEIVLRPNGVSENDLARVAREIGLPPIYRACANAWGLYGVSLGFFALWPSFERDGDLIAALVKANRNNEAPAALAYSRSLVIVGREEANWICVGSAGTEHEDIVYYLNTMVSPEWTIGEIAGNFDKFLILAANVHEIAHSGSVGIFDGEAAIARYCNSLGCNERQSEFWKGKISELLA